MSIHCFIASILAELCQQHFLFLYFGVTWAHLSASLNYLFKLAEIIIFNYQWILVSLCRLLIHFLIEQNSRPLQSLLTPFNQFFPAVELFNAGIIVELPLRLHKWIRLMVYVPKVWYVVGTIETNNTYQAIKTRDNLVNEVD
jgi:hypothetical protein